MSIGLSLPQKPRRTWRQWSKLTRVRIDCIVLPIFATPILNFLWWRQGIVYVVWLGGSVDGRSFENPIENTLYAAPAPVQAVVSPWFGPRRFWLIMDPWIDSADFSKVQTERIDFTVLRRFPLLTRLTLHGRQIGPGLEQIGRAHV